jgi:ABC-type lipoprotein release transport system permease subunit
MLTIALTIAVTIFLIYFTNALDLNYFITQENNYTNPYFFSGSINIVFSQFNTILIVLIFALAVVMVTIICSSFIVSKKRDITIMKALGTLPEKLYSFYLLEAFIIFLLGFFFGWLIGIIGYGIFSIIYSTVFIQITFQIEVIFSIVLFILCTFASLGLPGLQLRKYGRANVIKSFSKELPSDFNAVDQLKLVPKWLSAFGLNLKYAILNLVRKKSKFKRFFAVFFTISLILFTIGLGALVLHTSSSTWIEKAQGDEIIIIGHKDVVSNYSSMYQMFADPSVFVNEQSVNFTRSEYLFNFSQISQIASIEEVQRIDQRIVDFSMVKELITYKPIDVGQYVQIGDGTIGKFPIIGLNSSDLIQEFEIEGKLFNSSNPVEKNVTIGDGLAYNFFELAFDQELEFIDSGERFSVSGIVIDSFYSGYAVYVDIKKYWSILNFTNNEINLIQLQIAPNSYDQVKNQLESNISIYLGPDFTHIRLEADFEKNLAFLDYLSSYSVFLIILTSIVSIFSLYHFQKGDLSEKLKDFLIMRAIGSKLTNIGKILFFEGFFILVPSVLASLAGGMIINTVFLFERIALPPIGIPFLLAGIVIGALLILNLVVLIPILKRINKSSLRELKIF